MPTVKDESKDDVLYLTKSIFQVEKVRVLDNVLDLAHAIWPTYMDRINNKSIIVIHSETRPYSIGQEN